MSSVWRAKEAAAATGWVSEWVSRWSVSALQIFWFFDCFALLNLLAWWQLAWAMREQGRRGSGHPEPSFPKLGQAGPTLGLRAAEKAISSVSVPQPEWCLLKLARCSLRGFSLYVPPFLYKWPPGLLHLRETAHSISWEKLTNLPIIIFYLFNYILLWDFTYEFIFLY